MSAPTILAQRPNNDAAFTPFLPHHFVVSVEWPYDGAREDDLRLAAHLYDEAGRVLNYDLPRVDLPPGRGATVDYQLDPLAPGRYAIGFDLVLEGQYWLSDRGLAISHLPFEVVGQPPAPPRQYRIFEVPPGGLTLLAEDCFDRGDIDRSRSLADEAIRERPDDPDAWRLWSRLRERDGDVPAAYDAHKLAVGLTGPAASTGDRSRLVDLAVAGGATIPVAPALPRAEAPLHLVFAAPNMDPPVGGAELTWLWLIAAARSRGHRVTLLTDNRGPEPFARNLDLHRHADGACASSDHVIAAADLILTQQDWAPDMVTAARNAGRPSVVFAQSYELLCRRPWMLDRCGEGQCQCLAAETATGREALQRADLVLAASACVADHIRRTAGVAAETFYQLVDAGRTVPHRAMPLKAIVMNQPDSHKGGAVFEALARRLPRETFVTVGRAEKRNHALPNLFHLGSVEPRLLCSITDIMLVPSLWPEPFGRVALEAMMAGVPAVVSRRGGLPEVVGDAGLLVDDPTDIEAWVANIFRLKADRELRARLVEAGLQRSAAFDAGTEALRLLKRIEFLAK